MAMYKNILLPIDLNEETSWKTTLPTAVECARAFGATLHLATVVPDFVLPSVATFFPKGYEKIAIDQAKQDLKTIADDNVPDEVTVQQSVAYGTIYTEILRIAREIPADLIITASHRPELEDYLLGPNAARVVRHAGCSVLVVRD
jgi:nucleotide-binding universal stress UspA family protein